MSYNKTLQEINDAEVRVLIPAIIIILLLMVIGLIGNPLVIYFYGCRMKPTASYTFIVAVAFFDIITCAFSMPLELVDLINFYTFPNSEACRMLRFINYFASIASGSTLIAIAVDRFRRICKPFEKQISVKLSRIILVLLIIMSLVIASPSFVFYSVVAVNITTTDDIVGYDCTTIRDDDYVIYITIYNIFCFALFFITISVLIVLYSLVGKQLYKLKSRQVSASRKRMRAFDELSASPRKESSESVITSAETLHDKEGLNPCYSTNSIHVKNGVSNDELCKKESKANIGVHFDTSFQKSQSMKLSDTDHNRSSVSSNGAESTTGNDASSSNATQHDQSKRKKSRSLKIKAEKYTIVTLSISATFIISFLPYLALVTWRTLTPKYEPNLMSDSEMVIFQIFIRSFLFNSGCNPIIYGLLNSEFKTMVVGYLMRICCCRKLPHNLGDLETVQRSSSNRNS